ncbi:hypothetical protein ACJBXO_11770, partial [Streptococcus suis]
IALAYPLLFYFLPTLLTSSWLKVFSATSSTLSVAWSTVCYSAIRLSSNVQRLVAYITDL